ncbi:thiamine pyrophosphate-binding protein [soil metagenome]
MTQTRQVPVYEALAHDIRNLGIDAVFGLMSDDTAAFVSTLDAMGVRFYGARHENNACAMAEGYSAATGKLGIAVLGRGPATANAVHGAGYALRTGSRVMLICGETSTAAGAPNSLGPDTKTFNGVAVLQATGLRTFVASEPSGARKTLASAIAASKTGAVAFLLPVNVQFAPIDFDGPMAAQASRAAAPRPARAPAIKTAAAVLRESRRPLFIVGVGAFRAGAREAIEALADKAGAVLATTLKAKEMFRGNPYNIGVVGSFSHAAGRRLIDQADCVVAFGAGLNLRTTSHGRSIPSDVPLIQVDADRSHIGRWFHADVAIVADAKQAATQLAEALPSRDESEKEFYTADTRDRLAASDLSREFEAAHTARTIDPRAAAMAFDRLLPTDRNIVYDAGNFIQIATFVSVPGPGQIKQASDFGSIGMGFGTALGFAVGAPERPTVLFMGDGSFLMTMTELETAVREDIPLVIIVMNDAAYGAEVHYLKLRNLAVARSQFADVDLGPVAEAFGFEVATVRSLADIEALAPLLKNPVGHILIDCKINGAIAAPFLLEGFEAESRK